MQVLNMKQLLSESKKAVLQESRSTLQSLFAGAYINECFSDDTALAHVCQHELLQLSNLQRQNTIMRKIDITLDKIRQGIYGKCEECGEDISPERLKIMPFTAYCKDCQEAIETSRKAS